MSTRKETSLLVRIRSILNTCEENVQDARNPSKPSYGQIWLAKGRVMTQGSLPSEWKSLFMLRSLHWLRFFVAWSTSYYIQPCFTISYLGHSIIVTGDIHELIHGTSGYVHVMITPHIYNLHVKDDITTTFTGKIICVRVPISVSCLCTYHATLQARSLVIQSHIQC